MLKEKAMPEENMRMLNPRKQELSFNRTGEDDNLFSD
jgi:hypothetical protein